MIPQTKKQEATANNIANASTPGYKKDGVFTKELSRAERRQAVTRSDWERPMVDGLYTDYAPGIFDHTGNPLNLAIEGDGFFRLQGPEGNTVLTRNGSFQVDENGFLSAADGLLVMSEGGPIEIGSGQVTVAATGEVEVDGIAAGRIVPQTIADLENLEKIGSSLFGVPEGTELIPVEHAQVRQGFIEASNVDIVKEMVDMIISYRAYEANARAVQTQDESLNHLFNRVAGKQ
jgi:flagellar basal-body rod protein FlgG